MKDIHELIKSRSNMVTTPEGTGWAFGHDPDKGIVFVVIKKKNFSGEGGFIGNSEIRTYPMEKCEPVD